MYKKCESQNVTSTAIENARLDRANSLILPLDTRASRIHEFRRHSNFCEMLSTVFSEDSRLNEEKAVELETRLKNFVSAFSSRASKTKEEIRRPCTPSSEESDSDISVASEANLNERLKVFSPISSDEPSRQISPTFSIISGRILRNIYYNFHKVLKILRCDYVLDPQNNIYISWLFMVSLWFIYNAWVIPLRVIFPYQKEENLSAWIIMDCIADLIYLIDMVVFKSHTKFIQHGFWIKEPKETFKFYFFSRKFVVDLVSLCPVDIAFTFFYTNTPWLRIPRLLKVTTFWELFQILDNVLSSPHTARIARTLIYMLYMIHLNASAYYALSRWEGIGETGWTYDGEGNAYVRCFYFATKTATSIGKNPKPENEIEYLFMTCAWLSGVFVFAVLIGQIRDIVATATKAQTEYRQVCYATDNYLQRCEVPSGLQYRVKSWLSYTWEQQKTLDEGQILSQLPQKMQADIALHVHIDTLSKVKLFQNCEVAFLRDLVVKLRSIIFLPGDYVCRKGEVGKEMYIVKTGKIHVVGGANGSDILATLQEGAVFGEIALLAIGGVNKRTADVRSAGFSNLFVLRKGDLNSAIKDYPLAQESMRKKAKKIIREQSKKVKAEAAQKLEENTASGSPLSIESDKIIIKDKIPQPKFLNVLLKAMPKNSKTSLYMKYGSKASSSGSIYPELSSYPSSPFLPADHLGEDVSFSYKSDSSDDIYFPSFPEVYNVGKNNQKPYSQNNKNEENTEECTLDKSIVETSNKNTYLELTTTTTLPGAYVKFEMTDNIYTENKMIEETLNIQDDEINQENEQQEQVFPSIEQAVSIVTFSSKWKMSSLKRQFSVDNDENDG